MKKLLRHCFLPIVIMLSVALGLSCGSGHRFSAPVEPGETVPLTEEKPAASDPKPVISHNEDVIVKEDPKPVQENNETITPPKQDPPVIPVVVDPLPVACSTLYTIPGIANPFLAGMPDGTEIAYPASVDRSPVNSPVLVTPLDKQCFEAGRKLYFRVEGKIAHGEMSDQESDADGKPTAPMVHTLGNLNSLAMLKAPINSLIGVFLDDKTPVQRPDAPESLDFGEANLRNFQSLSPKIGQIFFIGDGKDASGKLQSFIVPTGTTRLYLAIMDAYEWNNNLGKLTGGILWVKP